MHVALHFEKDEEPQRVEENEPEHDHGKGAEDGKDGAEEEREIDGGLGVDAAVASAVIVQAEHDAEAAYGKKAAKERVRSRPE